MEAFKHLLEYIYTDNCLTLNQEYALEVIELANRFEFLHT